MFFHLLAGIFIFGFFGLALFGVSKGILLFGMFIAILSDIPYWYFLLKKKFTIGQWLVNKDSYLHRDSLLHSIFFPFIISPIGFIFNPDLVPAIFFASLSHPILDLWGIGWGVKLFYPFSDKTFKLFYKGKILTIFTPEKLQKHAQENGEDDWWQKVYIKFSADGVPSWYGKAEWGALLVSLSFLLLV